MTTTPRSAAPGASEDSDTRELQDRPVANPDPDQLVRATRLATAAHDLKALRLVVLDAREVSSFAETFILATGTSDRHTRAIADAVREAAQAVDWKPIGIEGYDEGRWILLDFGDTIVHVFTRELRDHYDLERLWSDAPRIDVGLPENGDPDGSREGEVTA